MTIAKPAKIPEWNTGGSNRTEPTAGEKVAGWAINDEPPSSYFNWLQYYTGAWFSWLDQHIKQVGSVGDLTVQAADPTASGRGHDLTLEATYAITAGRGGDLTATAGNGLSATNRGGNVAVTAGDGLGDGGDFLLTAGNSSSSGEGGDFTIEAGDGDGADRGGNVAVTAGDATGASGAGGAVNITAGDSVTSGAGGAVNITAGDSVTSGAGGNINIIAGDGATSGVGGDVSITGGAGTGTSEGGDINITGGTSEDDDGGDVNVWGGDASGDDQSGGAVSIRSGVGRGDRGGLIQMRCAEAGASGGAVRTPVDYVVMSGETGAKDIAISRRVSIDNTVDATRGPLQLAPDSQPSAPSAGDIYPDSNTNQLAIYNGTRYHNLNPTVYDLSPLGLIGYTPASPVASTPYVLEEFPYPSTTPPPNGTPIRYIIPAGTLRVGSIVRVRAIFDLLDAGGGASTYPNPKVYVGSVGAGPSPYNAPTGVQIFAPNRAQSIIWNRCFVECEMSVRSLGASGAVDHRFHSIWDDTTTAAHPIDIFATFNTSTVDTTGAIDVFPVALYGTSTQWEVDCRQFIIDVI